MNQPLEIDVQDIDHLGIIAGIIDESGIVDIINRLLGTHPREEVSAGHVVKALILNCWGFLTAPLYLFSQFFEGKATEHLIGPGVKPEHLNESRIGRVLDQLFKAGLTHVLMEIALAVVKRFGVSIQRAHLHSSSFCVQGEYLNGMPETDLGESEPLEESNGHKAEVYVADAALYNEENLVAWGQTPWISRVPATIAEAQQLMQSLPQEMFTLS